ncbi:MAG: tripartite tricarboxylate transporter permease, partial [Pseudomonadota bacterium]
ISAVSQGAMLKGLIGGLFGFAVATVGPDVSSGIIRLNFGINELNAGFRLLPTLLGLFVVSQLIDMLVRNQTPVQQAGAGARDILRNTRNMVRHWVNCLRSSIVGTWVGILPGVGSAVAAIVAYSIARNVSRKKEEFGKGSEEGIVAAESANNAAVNGALVPLIALGIPGSVVDAILIGALIIHNLQPGPGLFREQPDVAYGIIAAALIANVVMFAFMITCAGHIAKVARIPKNLLVPAILVFCVIGVYTTTNRFFDVWIMLGFGLVGYLLRRAGVPIGTVVLGFILAPIAESELRNGLMLYNGSLLPLVTRPIALAFVLASVVMLAWPLIARLGAARRRETPHHEGHRRT